MADDYMDAHMGRNDEPMNENERRPVRRTEAGATELGAHCHHLFTPPGHFDELIQLRHARARLDALLVDVLAVMEEMNSALNQHATGGRHPQAKEYHRAVMRAVKEEVKRSTE